jgi:hypothetical protein
MPTFLRTEHILTGLGEHFDPNWMDSDTIVLPPKIEWDYQRELRIEDVYIWEKIIEPWQYGVYAAWDPYAEFYILRTEINHNRDRHNPANDKPIYEFELFYGQGAQARLVNRLKTLNIFHYIKPTDMWIEPEKMWLYA